MFAAMAAIVKAFSNDPAVNPDADPIEIVEEEAVEEAVATE